jgi:hypothetical protein
MNVCKGTYTYGTGKFLLLLMTVGFGQYRFLRAASWTAPTAIGRLEQTLKWRRDWGMYSDINDPEVAKDVRVPLLLRSFWAHAIVKLASGGTFVFGYDKNQCPVIHVIPSKIKTDDPQRQTRMLVWMLERSIDLTGPGVE